MSKQVNMVKGGWFTKEQHSHASIISHVTKKIGKGAVVAKETGYGEVWVEIIRVIY